MSLSSRKAVRIYRHLNDFNALITVKGPDDLNVNKTSNKALKAVLPLKPWLLKTAMNHKKRSIFFIFIYC